MPGWVQTFQDTFHRADGAVGNGWDDVNDAWAIGSDTLTSSAASTADLLARPVGEALTDQRADVVATADRNTDNTASTPVVWLRADVAGRSGYLAWLGEGAGASEVLNVAVMTAGTLGPVTSTSPLSGIAAGTDYLISYAAVGTTMTVTIAAASAPGTILGTASIADSGFASGVVALTPLLAPNTVKSVTVYGAGTTPTIALSPATVDVGTLTPIALAGTGVAWTPGTPGSPTFGTSAGAVSSQSVASAGAATVNYGSSDQPGSVTITDPSSGATATLTVTSPTVTPTLNVVFAGNSLTAGNGSTDGQTYPAQCLAILGPTWTGTNSGVSSQTTAEMIAAYRAQIGQFFDGSKSGNVAIIWEGINDLFFGASAATAYGNLVTLCGLARAGGFKVAIGTCIPRWGFGTSTIPGTPEEQYATYWSEAQSVNASIRANWRSFADALLDVQADVRLGAPGSELDTTYRAVDQVHYNDAGYALVAGMAAAAIAAATTGGAAPAAAAEPDPFLATTAPVGPDPLRSTSAPY
jgi:lysophospholipase L1-like esterase